MLYHSSHGEILPDTQTNPPWHNMLLLPTAASNSSHLVPQGAVEDYSSGTPLLWSEVTVRKQRLKAKGTVSCASSCKGSSYPVSWKQHASSVPILHHFACHQSTLALHVHWCWDGDAAEAHKQGSSLWHLAVSISSSNKPHPSSCLQCSSLLPHPLCHSLPWIHAYY